MPSVYFASMARCLAACALAVLALSSAACERADHPGTPLPADTRWTLLDGGSVDVEALRGRPWVISLWVPGCHVCAREAPRVEALKQEFAPRGVGFLALSLEPDSALVRAGVAKLGISVPVALTRDEVLAPLGVRAVPSVAWVDASGTLRTTATGERSLEFLRRETAALLEPR